MIGKLMKEAKNSYAVVKYDNGFLVISKTIPDFIFNSEFIFGDYKGANIFTIMIENDKQEIIDAWRVAFKGQQKKYEELEKLKAPTLQKVAKELEKEINKYGLNRFIHQYQGYDRALLAGAIEKAFDEKVNLKGDITVRTVKHTLRDLEKMKEEIMHLALEIKDKETVEKVGKRFKEIEEEIEKRIKKIKEGKREVKVKKNFEKNFNGQISETRLETVNANKLKESIKKNMNEAHAWLALLTAWCDVKGHMSPISTNVPTIIYRAEQKIELKKPRKIEENGSLTGEVVNVVKNSKPTIYEYSALFDILARMYAQGELDKTEGRFAVIKGKMSKKQLEELKKWGHAIVDTGTIYRLLGNENVVFARNVKNVLWSLDELRYDLMDLSGNDQVVKRYRFVYPWRPPEGVPDEIEFFNHSKGWRGFEIREDLFKIYKRKNIVTYALVDNASFYKISEAGKRLGVGPRTVSDTTDMWLYLIKTAGSKPAGQRIAYVSYRGKGVFELTSRHHSKKNEMKERTKGTLIVLAEAGLINDFFPLKGKKEFGVDIGG